VSCKNKPKPAPRDFFGVWIGFVISLVIVLTVVLPFVIPVTTA
jgi:type IV secretory pathway VirB6-like protein